MKSRHALSVSASWRHGAAVVVAALLCFPGALSVYGFVFALGEVNGSFDSTFSIGTLYRLDNPDPAIYGIADTFQGVPGKAYSVNNDDGDLNYPRGTASVLFKGTHDLELNWQNWSAFFRGYYFYDPRNRGTTRPHLALSQAAEQKVGSAAVMLDSYIAGKFDLGSMPCTIKLGRQVISWGESTFIPNGINVINPIDVQRLRAPGSELREALLPVYAWDTTVSLTPNLSLEALWLLEFRKMEIDPDGTYFSTTDIASPGGNKVFLGFGTLPDNGTLGAIPRSNDHVHGNYGQWGVALRYTAPQLNDTEFGLYYLRYSSRLPVISAMTPTTPVAPLVPGALAQLLVQNGAATAGNASAVATQLLTVYATAPQLLNAQQQALIAGAQKLAFLGAAATGRYYIDYPKGIDLVGASFNTDVGRTGIALQGEVSFKSNVPLQVDDVELLFATLSSLNPVYGANNQIGSFLGQMGAPVSGYRTFDVWQAQATATKVFGRALGADQLTVLGEIGATDVPGLPDKGVLRFDGSGTNTAGSAAEMLNTGNGAYPATPAKAFADRFSWGYQLAVKLDYNNLFAGVNVSPTLAFAQDIDGNTPLPLGNFLQGRRTLTLGADFNYQNRWALELRYVNFAGDKPYNLLADRDYVSATMKYSF
jgi:Protein of unknown function (DUF1302)